MTTGGTELRDAHDVVELPVGAEVAPRQVGTVRRYGGGRVPAAPR